MNSVFASFFLRWVYLDVSKSVQVRVPNASTHVPARILDQKAPVCAWRGRSGLLYRGLPSCVESAESLQYPAHWVSAQVKEKKERKKR